MNEASLELHYEEAGACAPRTGAGARVGKTNVDWGGAKDQDVVGLSNRIIIIRFVFCSFAQENFLAVNHSLR